MNWLMKIIGLRYYLHYVFPSETNPGIMISGRNGPYLKSSADYLAAYYNFNLSGRARVEMDK